MMVTSLNGTPHPLRPHHFHQLIRSKSGFCLHAPPSHPAASVVAAWALEKHRKGPSSSHALVQGSAWANTGPGLVEFPDQHCRGRAVRLGSWSVRLPDVCWRLEGRPPEPRHRNWSPQTCISKQCVKYPSDLTFLLLPFTQSRSFSACKPLLQHSSFQSRTTSARVPDRRGSISPLGGSGPGGGHWALPRAFGQPLV